MIQSGLFFVLGFVSAVFLALIIAPALWRRAGYLTRKRVESSIALTVNEVQSEKDRLRADHARALRKLEMKSDALRDEKAELMSKISRHAAGIDALKKTLEEREGTINSLTEAKTHLETDVAEKDMRIISLDLAVDSKASEIMVLKNEIEIAKAAEADVRNRLAGLMETLEQRESDLQQTRDRVMALTEKRREDQARMRDERTAANTTAEQLRTERSRVQTLETQLEKAVREKTDLEERLDRREKDLERLRDAQAAGDTAQLEQRLADVEKERAKLAEELAAMAQSGRGEGMGAKSSSDASALQVELNAMQIQLGGLKAELKSALRERDRARAEAAAAKGNFSVTAGSGPVRLNLGTDAPSTATGGVNDDVLRNQMNEIAAEMVALTALLEGDKSPINDLIDRSDIRESGEVISLADRIRMLRGKLADAAE